MIFAFKVIHYYLQMYIENFQNKSIELDLAHILSVPELAWQVYLKKQK